MREDQFDGYVREVEGAARRVRRADRRAPGPRGRLRRGPGGGSGAVARRAPPGTSCSDPSTGSPATGSTTRRARPAASRAREPTSSTRSTTACSRGRPAAALFDVLTHFDLPKKHGHRPETPRTGAENAAIAAAAAAGCAVEISSAGLRKPVAEAYPEARLLDPHRRGGNSGDVLLRRARPGRSRLGLRPHARARPGLRRRRVRHSGRSPEGPAPAPEVRCAPSRAKRSAEGLRRRPIVA